MALLIPGIAAVSSQSGSTSSSSLGKINNARSGRSLARLEPSAALDGLAANYLDDLLARRDLMPAGYGALGERILSDDVAEAIGEDGYSYRYVGVVVAYGQSVNHAMDIAVGTVANGPALFEPALSYAGIASGIVSPGQPWFAPPPGGFGRQIEMTGMTMVVIVTAGAFRAGT